eukprot:TRINITY_DN12472_c0_g1_i1.p1 TRINITY_DN12472_c0_g1~~TRINITY_DN12472_c0_g1_i1.p1  ORF type:complete len:142 (-),score=21.27 TRINITY_DN12472_c0_g1_i1:89-514(-)
MAAAFISMIETLQNKLGNVGGIFWAFIIFFCAGLCEIGGGWIIWQTLRENLSLWKIIFGIFLVSIYGVIACFQLLQFSQAYATYGGIFIIMSIFWGWLLDGYKPSKYDFIGAAFCLVGVIIIVVAAILSNEARPLENENRT